MTHPHIFFDLDGTLTDPREGITGSIQYALEQLGVAAPDKAELEWCIGPPLHDSFVHLVGEPQAADAVEHYRVRFDDRGWSENEPYQGIHDALAELVRSGRTLYVASSKPRIFVERILTHFELREFFTGVHGSELDGTRVDKRELLAYALENEQVAAHQALMLGDRKHDKVGAAHNNMDFVGVLWGYGSAAELRDAGAERLFSDIEQLLSLVD